MKTETAAGNAGSEIDPPGLDSGNSAGMIVMTMGEHHQIKAPRIDSQQSAVVFEHPSGSGIEKDFPAAIFKQHGQPVFSRERRFRPIFGQKSNFHPVFHESPSHPRAIPTAQRDNIIPV